MDPAQIEWTWQRIGVVVAVCVIISVLVAVLFGSAGMPFGYGPLVPVADVLPIGVVAGGLSALAVLALMRRWQ